MVGEKEIAKMTKSKNGARILANPNPNCGGIIEKGANGKIRLKSLILIHKIFNNNLFFCVNNMCVTCGQC